MTYYHIFFKKKSFKNALNVKFLYIYDMRLVVGYKIKVDSNGIIFN